MYRSPDTPADRVLIGLRRSAPWAAFAALAAALVAGTGCGPSGGDDAPPITIAFERQALLSEASLLVIYFYDDAQTCDGIRAVNPRQNFTLGPFQAVLDNLGRQRGITVMMNDVPKGTYVIFVDALDATGTVVATGCAPHQMILDRKLAHVQITVS